MAASFLATAIGALLGCAGTLEDPGSSAWRAPNSGVDAGGSCAETVDALFTRKCVNGICHGADSQVLLDLESPGLPGRLVGATGTGDCAEHVLVDPELPEQSLIYLKLEDPPCGDPMPLGSQPGALPRDEVSCLLSWIQGIGEGDGSGL